MIKETECPVCSAYIPLEPDTRPGAEIYCSYCNSRLKITRKLLDADGEETDKAEAEEDWEG